MRTRHSDVNIEYDEQRNTWSADDDDKEIQLERNSLTELKKAIDDKLRAKQEGRFKRFTAIKKGRRYGYGSRGNRYLIVTVTSILETKSSMGNHEGWITYEKVGDERPDREKIYLSSLYADTPENREIMKVANKQMAHIENEEKELKAVEEKLEALNITEDEDEDNT